MDGEAFEIWLSAVVVLTDQQRGEVFRALALAEARRNEPVAADAGIVPCEASRSAELAPPRPRLPEAEPVTAAAERRVEATGCPHCCRRSFNGLTGTPLARLRKKDRWAAQTAAMLAGESLAKAAKRCGVAASTALRWRHRFLQAPALDKPTKLTGIVEADETFILESFKGKLPKPGGPRPEAPNLPINNVNAYHGRLKEWLRPFHGVATKYLNRYLGWRRSLEALGDNREQPRWLGAAMGRPVCQQLTR